MKIDRLMGILTLLLRQERTTAPELAERFEVSRRTINRDIEALCKAGLPIVTTQGQGGGISIAEGYRIDRTVFTREELQSVLAGLMGMDSVSPTPRRQGLAEKFSAETAPADEVFFIDLASHYQQSLTRKIDVIKAAIADRRLISFQYACQTGTSRRVIEPYRLVFKWSAWYVWGYCPKREVFRLFKLNRLWDLETGAAHGMVRELPLEELTRDAYLSQENYRLKALFREDEAYRLIDEYGVGCYTETDEGLYLERSFAGYENMRQWVLSFGSRARVLAPEELREDLSRQAREILSFYLET